VSIRFGFQRVPDTTTINMLGLQSSMDIVCDGTQYRRIS
jgi:hypothetical protein